MDDISGTLNCEAGPFLHRSAVYIFLGVLAMVLVRSGVAKHLGRLTSNVNHEMGSSSGIEVFLTNVSVRASSSNSTV